ncbi:MAG TPA: MBL fold metallo-hydrolase [Clostridiaceae bacterium]|jgi:hydroxyacylglutathione hydrolase|nr:MBL fold metallo-hydrolase [Clostridiaceae bacterium]
MLSSNCYILISKDEATVIDPCIEPDLIVNRVDEYSAKIEKIIYTHAHIDHVYYGDDLKKITGAKTYGHIGDKDLYGNVYKNGAVLFGMNKKFDVYDIELSDNQVFKIGDKQAVVIHTPGHTMGSICIHVNNSLFTGDTLFYESVGRTDLGTGNTDMLIDSIKNRIYTLPEETVILPGHGVKSRVGHERANNPFV